MQSVCVGEVARALEESLQALLGAGNHGCVVTEQQAAEDRHQHNAEQIARTALLSVRTHLTHDPVSGRVIVIEINPRTSRSSALASKATGFPIALVSGPWKGN